ncbi:MAG: MoaD/ThiS family protein [Deltaproteobacteria bacterium]|nr:MoaD/ThiS family protein [Deltaproteobacteria bacterium]
MGVKVNLHVTLRKHTDGREAIDVEGRTVGECLRNVVKQFPGLEASLFDKKGGLSHLVEIYLNHSSAYPNELAKPVKDGDEIHVTMMLSGG